MTSERPQRIDTAFLNDMKLVRLERIKKGFANPSKKNEISIREMTSLLRKTTAYQKVLEELKTKPKKK